MFSARKCTGKSLPINNGLFTSMVCLPVFNKKTTSGLSIKYFLFLFFKKYQTGSPGLYSNVLWINQTMPLIGNFSFLYTKLYLLDVIVRSK